MGQMTRKGRVTEEHLATLEEYATRYKTSYPMGINNKTMIAIIEEIREYRASNCDHEMTVNYTIDDDGLHLWCETCKVELPLGFSPTVAEIVAAESKHRSEI